MALSELGETAKPGRCERTDLGSKSGGKYWSMAPFSMRCK
jgi:hypothetical protein